MSIPSLCFVPFFSLINFRIIQKLVFKYRKDELAQVSDTFTGISFCTPEAVISYLSRYSGNKLIDNFFRKSVRNFLQLVYIFSFYINRHSNIQSTQEQDSGYDLQF